MRSHKRLISLNRQNAFSMRVYTDGTGPRATHHDGRWSRGARERRQSARQSPGARDPDFKFADPTCGLNLTVAGKGITIYSPTREWHLLAPR